MSLTILLAAFQVTTLSAPLSEPPPVPAAARITAAREMLAAEAQARKSCQNATVQHAAGPVQPVMNDLLYRQSDVVRGYRLVERTVEGCSIPISWPHSQGAAEAPVNASEASGQ